MIPFLFAQIQQIQPVEPTNVNQVQQEFIIDGGELAGDNIFHTFEQFNLDQGQIAEFLANPQTRNIFNRVIGGDPSIIDGILKVTGGSPDFYFLNPNGIVFGRNAYIDVPAAFYGSTASSVQFGNSGFPRYREESEWFASPIAEDRIGLVSEVSELNPSFLAFQTLTNPIINLGTIQAGGRIDLSGSSIVSLGNLNAPEINFSLIKLSFVGYKVSVEDNFWTLLTRNYIPSNFLSYQGFYQDIGVYISTNLSSRTVFIDYFDSEFKPIDFFVVGILDSLSNQEQNIFRLGGIGDDFSYDLNLAIEPDIPDNLVVDEPDDLVVDEPDDLVVDEPDDLVVDEPDDLVVDEPDDLVVDEPDDLVVDEPDDPVVDEPDDLVVDEPDDPVVDEPDDLVVDEPDDLVVDEPDDLVDNFQIDKVDFSFWDISKSPNEEVNFILTQPRICYYSQLIYGNRHCLLHLNVQNQNYPNELTEQQFYQILKRGE
ncbi:two-partner secretion domain-containing protein [Coleofasciculus sp. E1-EBD-02]|uniref:two-partner secretion domain-containing protein n=1 Tax=Coleofasciculus sp. E1-EBD-02 TaxID=3068481 RepID=UPI003300C307